MADLVPSENEWTHDRSGNAGPLIEGRRRGLMEKTDRASAYRRLKSPNIKTRKRALKIIKADKRNRTTK